MKKIALIIAVLTLSTFQAKATPVITCNQQGCSDRVLNQPTAYNKAPAARSFINSEAGTAFLPHPSGCPRRAFCACGASVEVFGRSIRALWPARAWFKFPRTSPGYKMVAVRNHHVFVLISQVDGNNWLVKDYNSGGHMSRQHVVSIRGWTIVNPTGSLAGLQRKSPS